MEAPTLEQFGLTSERAHQIEDRLWRLRILAAIGVGAVGGVVGYGLLRDYLVTRGSRDIVYDSLMMALPLAIFLAIASGMACFILSWNLPFPLGRGDAMVRDYRKAVARFQRGLYQSRHQYWTSLASRKLLRQVENLYRGLGYEILPPPASEAESVDFLLRKGDTTALVNCRRQEGPVEWRAVRAVAEAQKRLAADRAVVISIAGFTPRARRFATGKSIGLLSVRELANMQLHLEAHEGTAATATVPARD